MSRTIGCNILLTGLPRSGTNLTCTLLNRVDQTIALAEPMDVVALGHARDRCDALWQIEKFLQVQRHSLLTGRSAVTKHLEGQVRDNFFADAADRDGLRTPRSELGPIRFDKPLGADFRLVVKHPAAFSALLPELSEAFSCFALIRNPLSVLASWNSNRLPIREGHIPAAEEIDPELKRRLAAIPTPEARQIFLLDWFFGRYLDTLRPHQLIRYEELVASGGRALSVIAPAAQALDEPLSSRNANPLYKWKGLHSLAQRLLDSDGSYWRAYDRQDVQGLFDRAVAQAG
jgi:hypothetical protein